jgi:hypothetical protein
MALPSSVAELREICSARKPIGRSPIEQDWNCKGRRSIAPAFLNCKIENG